MIVELFCLRCETEIYYDEIERHWCCECFATITEPDEDGMPNLAFVPDYWVDTEAGAEFMAIDETEEYLKEQRYLDWKEVAASYNKDRSPIFHFRIPFLAVMWWDDSRWSIGWGKAALIAIHAGHIELLIG